MGKTFKARNLDDINNKDSMLGTTLQDLQDAINNMAEQLNAAPQGNPDPPNGVTGLTVTSAGGVFDVAIFDNNPVARGIHYFLEYSTSPAFVAPTTISLGPSRNYRTFLGAQTLYFRAFSQYMTSEPSPVFYYGSAAAPTPVSGGGAIPGPVPQASKGSGTGSVNGQDGGSGFGKVATRNGNAAGRNSTR